MNPKHQKWVNLTLCFLMIFTCLGFCSSSRGLFLSAICDALEVKRTVFSLSTSCRFIVTAIVNLFFGTLISRIGSRKMIIAGILSLMISMLLNSVANTISVFFFSEICSGIGFSLSGTAVVGSVVNRWSPENKGTVMGFILCANGIGGAVCTQLITPIIYDSSDIFGYRSAYRLIILALLILLVIFFLFFRENPVSLPTQSASGSSGKKGNSWPGVSFETARRQPCFYAALICIFFTGFCLQGITGISAAHMKDSGLDTSLIAAVSSLSLLILTGSKFLTGFMHDRLGLRKTATFCCICASLCMLLLSLIGPSSAGKAAAIAYAVFSSIALPLETVMLPLYAGDFFGTESFNRIMGIFIAANTAGYALGTPFANLSYDLTGSYIPVLCITAIIMIAVTLTLQYIITASHRLRQSL